MGHVWCVAGFVALILGSGCAMIRKGPETYILGVVVDGGRGTASNEQIAQLEQRVAPILAARGLRISHDKDDADLLVRIELQVDPVDPRRMRGTIREIQPNPYLSGARGRPNRSVDRTDAELRADLRRDEIEFTSSK